VEQLLAVLAVISAVVWTATEGIGRIFPWRKDRIAIVLGPISGVVAHGIGQLSLSGHGYWDWIAAGFFGLLATLAAGVANDYIVRSAQKEKGGGS
jgi:hypothetical protein